jgi:ketosteroid isomerase-like protein
MRAGVHYWLNSEKYDKKDNVMSVMEIGQKMVEHINQGRSGEETFVNEFYADGVTSIEGGGSDEMPATIEGVDAVRGKHNWWYDNNDVHSTQATGPYVGNREDQFILRFVMDMTPKDGERMKMDEVAIYTVKDGKIAREEYLYLMG